MAWSSSRKNRFSQLFYDLSVDNTKGWYRCWWWSDLLNGKKYRDSLSSPVCVCVLHEICVWNRLKNVEINRVLNETNLIRHNACWCSENYQNSANAIKRRLDCVIYIIQHVFCAKFSNYSKINHVLYKISVIPIEAISLGNDLLNLFTFQDIILNGTSIKVILWFQSWSSSRSFKFS